MSKMMDTLVLLAFKPSTGILAKNYLSYAIPGAILIELTKSNQITFDQKGKVTLLDPAPTGDFRLDEALEMMGKAKKPRPASQWVMSFANKIKKLTNRSADILVQHGSVRVEEKSFLGIFRWKQYTLIDPSARDQFVSNVLAALRGEASLDVELLPTIQVANAVGLMRQHLPKEHRKEMLKALKKIGRDEATGKAVDAAVAAATMAATTAATSAAITSSTS